MKWKTIYALTFFGYENGLVFPIYVSDQTFVDSLDLLLLIDDDSKSRNWIHCVHFNLVTKTVINHRFRLEISFEEISFMIHV